MPGGPERLRQLDLLPDAEGVVQLEQVPPDDGEKQAAILFSLQRESWGKLNRVGYDAVNDQVLVWLNGEEQLVVIDVTSTLEQMEQASEGYQGSSLCVDGALRYFRSYIKRWGTIENDNDLVLDGGDLLVPLESDGILVLPYWMYFKASQEMEIGPGRIPNERNHQKQGPFRYHGDSGAKKARRREARRARRAGEAGL